MADGFGKMHPKPRLQNPTEDHTLFWTTCLMILMQTRLTVDFPKSPWREKENCILPRFFCFRDPEGSAYMVPWCWMCHKVQLVDSC